MHGSLLCMGSQAWSKRDVTHDVTQLHAKSKLKVKSNTLMHQAIIIVRFHKKDLAEHFNINVEITNNPDKLLEAICEATENRDIWKRVHYAVTY